MFDKTKRKIVFTVVLSLLILMMVTLATIYISNRIALERESLDMLRTFVERFTLDEMKTPLEDPGRESEPMERPYGMYEPEGGRFVKNEPVFRLSTFYSVAYSKDGDVLQVRSGNSDIQSEEDLISQADAILKKSRSNGRSGKLIYLVEERDSYTLVAMIDVTMNDKNQGLLIKQMLIIGGISMAVLFAVSVFIARRIVKPLEENDERQRRFVSDAGHELKTPTAVISANSELLRREIGENEWLSNITYENERMSDLIKQLLALSRAESRDMPKEALDLSHLTEGEVLPFETLAFEKGCSINAAIESGIIIEGDRGKLCQLVSILLDNALSHGTGDSIDLKLCRESHFAILSVSNASDEMGPEQLSHLFDRFYRSDESRNESGAHYGLGLSIAAAVTKAHGGHIKAEYKDGRAVFTVSLPLKKNLKL
ncbi:MAG: HAMP domain-containing histidine kinase [Lachnospiraceae bacterium]|nr:HAMP domain-containing histidine kinase [Lachnospiraceae bacterium]